MLKQVILNLFINAQQAMSNGGDLMIRTDRREKDALIQISDTGTGITPDKLPRIFDAYYTSRPQGSGLGLPTAKKIIEASQDNPSIKKINDTQSMDEAVKMTLSLAETGDVVVLSPASASFDRYKNYHKRGEIFKKAVLNLHE